MHHNHLPNAELQTLLRAHAVSPTRMPPGHSRQGKEERLEAVTQDVVRWLREKGIMRGRQKNETARLRPWVSAAMDRGLGDTELTARLLMGWVREVTAH